MAPMDIEKNIVVIGGGIIGCTTAYFLSRHPLYNPSKHHIILLEASRIAGGASGKAGGLLGLWAYPANIVPLSYNLHAELAAQHNGEQRWGYRKIHCGQLSARGRLPPPANGKNPDPKSNGEDSSISLQKRDAAALSKLTAAGLPKDLSWVSPGSAQFYYPMGDPNTTAQVHPYQFTTSMASLAEEAGANIILGKVTSINQNPAPDTPGSPIESSVKSVTYTQPPIPHPTASSPPAPGPNASGPPPQFPPSEPTA